MPADERPDGELWSRYISGEMRTGKRDALLQRFRTLEAKTRGLLSNARCLAEGVDVPAIDGVTFIDPRRSTIDIIQAVGRAIRKSPEKRLGVVVLPVFVSDDQDPQKVLEDSSFKPVWDVLKALRAHDEVLAEELDALRRRLGKEKGVTVATPEKIRLDLPATVGKEFARAFDVRLVLQTTASWEFWFGLLERFVEREGHSRVPARYEEEDFILGRWVEKQRIAYRNGRLDADRARRLEELPAWSWDPFEEQWEEGLAAFEKFVQRHGHARVPHAYVEDGVKLGSWVDVQRRAYRHRKLDPERKHKLEGLEGWVWDPSEALWEDGFARLEDFVDGHRHAQVPRGYVDESGFPLANWVNTQRAFYRREKLPPERASRLEALPGWEWQPHAVSWERRLEELKQFIERKGHARVPGSHELAAWVQHQRQEYKRGKLHPERVRRLKAIPEWEWDPHEASWDEYYAALKRFTAHKGHARVPYSHEEDGFKLGEWVANQRSAHKGRAGRKMDAERRRRLEELPGWVWDAREARWEQKYAVLEQFVEQQGHAQVPKGYVKRQGQAPPMGRRATESLQAKEDGPRTEA